MIKEAIILAGGLGTRLRSVVADLPKCLALVKNRPFLYYVIDHLKSQGIEKFIFALGYKHELISDFLLNYYQLINYQLSIEKELLGTGGAIRLACDKTSEQNVLIVNGDTLFKIEVNEMADAHFEKQSDCTLALKPMHNFDRYGTVVVDKDDRIISFAEKKFCKSGLINGGVYTLNVTKFLSLNFSDKFSFENDYLEKYCGTEKMYGVVQDNYFIDIGIPEDYEKAQRDL